jgi:hypothetical protein
MSINVLKAFRSKPIVIYPIYLDLTGDYATAAALAQVLYWHETMHDNKFWKTDKDFQTELHLTEKQFRRVKTALKNLPFLTIKAEQNPAKTFYDVDYKILEKSINKINQKGETRPAQKGETRPAQKGETRPAQKGETRPAQKGETLYTENTTEITRDNNNTPKLSEMPSDKKTLLLLFFNEKQTAKAMSDLESLSTEQQALAILIYEHQAAKGIDSFKTTPAGFWQWIIDTGKEGKLKPIKSAINDLTMQSTEVVKTAGIEKIKALISKPETKTKMLADFEKNRAIMVKGYGHFYKDELKNAGLFD